VRLLWLLFVLLLCLSVCCFCAEHIRGKKRREKEEEQRRKNVGKRTISGAISDGVFQSDNLCREGNCQTPHRRCLLSNDFDMKRMLLCLLSLLASLMFVCVYVFLRD